LIADDVIIFATPPSPLPLRHDCRFPLRHFATDFHITFRCRLPIFHIAS
jgi:hypothetical protein